MDKNDLMKLAIEKLNKPSKLTPEQVDHFLRDGIFEATYQPCAFDVDNRLLSKVGKKVRIYRNYELSPCIDAPEFMGEYKFFVEGLESSGWSPESDFDGITIVDETVEGVSRWPATHQYGMIYTDRESCVKNLGNYGKTCELPLIIGRSYNTERHDYVLNHLSTPKADLVLYRNYPGEWIEL